MYQPRLPWCQIASQAVTTVRIADAAIHFSTHSICFDSEGPKSPPQSLITPVFWSLLKRSTQFPACVGKNCSIVLIMSIGLDTQSILRSVKVVGSDSNKLVSFFKEMVTNSFITSVVTHYILFEFIIGIPG